MKRLSAAVSALVLLASLLSLSVFSSTPLRAQGGEDAAGAAQRIVPAKHMILLFHDRRTFNESAANAQGLLVRQGQELRQMLATLQDDQYAAVISCGGTEMRVLQDFTQNFEDLAQAIDAALRGKGNESLPGQGAVSLLDHLPAATNDAGSFYAALSALAEGLTAVQEPVFLTIIGEIPRLGDRADDLEGDLMRKNELEEKLRAANVHLVVIPMSG